MIADLGRLQGPDSGTVKLPIWLDWTPAPEYDLGDIERVQVMYETVLGEAMNEADLTRHLNRAVLIRIWGSLILPEFIRQGWEGAHPELRTD